MNAPAIQDYLLCMFDVISCTTFYPALALACFYNLFLRGEGKIKLRWVIAYAVVIIAALVRLIFNVIDMHEYNTTYKL